MEFRVTIGPEAGKKPVMILNNRKAQQAVRERSGDWIEWLQFEEDPKGTSIQVAIWNAVEGQFQVTVRDGWVTSVEDPGEAQNWERVERKLKAEARKKAKPQAVAEQPEEAVSGD